MAKAYVFPGQGAQFSGMGKDLYEENAKAKELFERANEILGFRITDIMFDGSAEELKQTRVTQPAVFIHSVVKALCLEDFRPDMVAGHSLGEFSALTAVGALSFDDGLRLVATRATAMQKACEQTPSTMAAILGLDDDIVEKICAQITRPAYAIVAATYNSPGQIVTSGSNDAIVEACAKLKEAGARRALPLAVGGAFHSPLMEQARVELAQVIETTTINTPQCRVYQNVDAQPHTNPTEIKTNLLSQLTSPVLWTQSVRNMIADGMTDFVECGPGTVLTGLINRIKA